MGKFKVCLLLLAAVVSGQPVAAEKYFLTVDELVANGYSIMSGQQIREIMANRAIRVIDIETEAVSISENNKSSNVMDRKFVETKTDKTSLLLDPRLMARSPTLEGKIKRKVVGDELISTDGVRTYHYRLYKKQNRIFAVRDIDHGDVFFEVEIK